MNSFKEYYMGKTETKNDVEEQTILKINEDSDTFRNVETLQKIIEDYSKRVHLPSVVKTRLRVLNLELLRILKALK